MGAGNFRDRIVIQRLITGDDGYGNTVEDWQDHLSVWADMLETPGREVVLAGRVEAPRTATVRVRTWSGTSGISEADRLRARERIWNIRSIAPIGRRGDLLEWLCETEVAS